MKAASSVTFVLMLLILLFYLVMSGRFKIATEALQGKLVLK